MDASIGLLAPAQAKQSFSVTKKAKIVDDKVDKRVTELKEHEKKKQLVKE